MEKNELIHCLILFISFIACILSSWAFGEWGENGALGSYAVQAAALLAVSIYGIVSIVIYDSNHTPRSIGYKWPHWD